MSKKLAVKKGIDKSPKVFQRDKLSQELHIRERDDLTEKQLEILKTALAKDTRCIFLNGVFGSGKTWLSVLASLKLLNQKKVDQIIYVRNPVESSSTGKMGYLKGSLEEKLEPYASIIYDKLEELLSPQEIELLKKENRVEAIPLGFCRGKSWNCKAVIVDEASCISYEDAILLISRCGEFTRIFFIGDEKNQADIKNPGLEKMMSKFNDEISKENGIFCYELYEKQDVVRSGFLRFVLEHLGIIK